MLKLWQHFTISLKMVELHGKVLELNVHQEQNWFVWTAFSIIQECMKLKWEQRLQKLYTI